MRKQILSFLLICGIAVLSACSLIGVTEVTGYKMTVEVRDTNNVIVEAASVTSTADSTKKTKPGIYTLLYGKTGLYVVTISAPDKQTKQIKVNVPADQDKVFTVILNDK